MKFSPKKENSQFIHSFMVTPSEHSLKWETKWKLGTWFYSLSFAYKVNLMNKQSDSSHNGFAPFEWHP
jgi:hypothetical protein